MLNYVSRNRKQRISAESLQLIKSESKLLLKLVSGISLGVLLFSKALSAQPSYAAELINWGDSKDKVKRVENATFIDEAPRVLLYETTLNGRRTSKSYIFENNKLREVSYQINYDSVKRALEDYGKYLNLISQKYSNPLQNDTIWYIKNHSNNLSQLLQGLSQGLVKLYSSWEDIETKRDLTLRRSLVTGRPYLHMSKSPLEIQQPETTKHHFNFTAFEFYNEQLSDWKAGLFIPEDSEFEIVQRNDTILIFTAENNYISEMFRVASNSKKKVTYIERLIFGKETKLSSFFPHKYPLSVSDVIKKLGNPDIFNVNQPLESPFANSDAKFSNYSFWKDVNYAGTKANMVMGELEVSSPIGQTSHCGYISYRATGSHQMTRADSNIYTAKGIAKGMRQAWNRNKPNLKTYLGPDKFHEAESWWSSEDILMSFLFSKNSSDPKEYTKSLFALLTDFYQIIDMYDINDTIYSNQLINPTFTFTSLPNEQIAIAEGMNKDCCIHLIIDSEQWMQANYMEKYFIMFHELGHDVFNFKHSDGLRLMATTEFHYDDPVILGEMIHEMLMRVVKMKASN